MWQPIYYLLLPLENDMRVPMFLLSCRTVVENVKSGDRFIKLIARSSDQAGVERFRFCSSEKKTVSIRKSKSPFVANTVS